MRTVGRWLVAGFVLLLGRLRLHEREPRERIVPPGAPSRGAETAVMLLFLAAATSATAFPVIYAIDRIPHQTQFLGLSIGLALALVAAACIVIGRSLVVDEELAEPYPPEEHELEQAEIEQIVEESGSRITRKRLLLASAGAAGTAIGAAAITPVLGFGPFLDVSAFSRSPWKRGTRLVDESGRPLRAADVEQETFITAFPQGADREQLGAPVVVVRLDPADVDLPADRVAWAPQGILAYSKICTHAGCAISLYRKPTFPDAQPRPALVCPCHYSTFDPATGGSVLFGPAGRPLPQLPLLVDRAGMLRSAGNFSGPVGPSWWGVRNRRAHS